jgi:UDP-2,3-diacylglucosamine hydrolase
MTTLLFSDVHLNVAPDGREKMAEFTAFLRAIDPGQVRRAVVLGDLFDFWFEYRHVIFSGYFGVLRAFADLRDAGVELHFVCGNHDFWAGRFLRDDLGFIIHPDTVTLDFGGRRTLLAHGDGINPGDWSYRAYKRFARNPLVVRAFRAIHPDWAMRIAQGVSRSSRHFNSADEDGKGTEINPLRDFAQGEIDAGRAHTVICGHSHHPELTPLGPEGLYINTGDWLFHRSYARWTPVSGFELLYWTPGETVR